MQFGHLQAQQPEVFGSRPVLWPASLVGAELAMGALETDPPEKLDRLSSDLAFEPFPEEERFMTDKTSGFQVNHLKDPVCKDVWREGVDGHLHWLSAFRTQELRLLLINVLGRQFWSPVSSWASYLQTFCAKGVLAGEHLV